jgi:hypothetical protein
MLTLGKTVLKTAIKPKKHPQELPISWKNTLKITKKILIQQKVEYN